MCLDKYIYADNAATTPLSVTALEAMLPFLHTNFANTSQLYSFARDARNALQKSRETIANCIGAKPHEIYFTSGGSESNNWVIRGAIDFETDIVISSIEHHSILKSVEYAQKCGNNVSILPVNRKGVIELPTLIQEISLPGTLVSIMTANNEIGSLQEIATLAKFTHDIGGIFHTDAVQAVGHIWVDVNALGVDMLSASAHKFNGPKGIGFLFIREGMKWPNLIYGGKQEFGFRAGTENIASIVGMATALQENINSLGENIISLRNSEKVLLDELDNLGVRYIRNGDDRHIPGNISLSFEGFEGEMLLHRLDLKKIIVSTGSACDNMETQVSHVLKAIGLPEDIAKGTIRISLGHQNTIEEVKTIARAIRDIVNVQSSKSEIIFSNNNTSETQNTEATSNSLTERNLKFYIQTIGCNAIGVLTSDGKIVICKGSILRLEVTKTFERKNQRNQIISTYCTPTDDGYLVNEDLPPMSPSGSSGIVQGRSSNGKQDWKDSEGKSLGYYLENL